jgi:hypothetical protein
VKSRFRAGAKVGRTALGWQIDHFIGYFGITAADCRQANPSSVTARKQARRIAASPLAPSGRSRINSRHSVICRGNCKLRRAVADQRKAVDRFLNQFQAGTVAFTTVVLAEIQVLADQEAELMARQNLFLASVNLIVATVVNATVPA